MNILQRKQNENNSREENKSSDYMIISYLHL